MGYDFICVELACTSLTYFDYYYQSMLTNGSRRKLNAKKTKAHDDVTHGTMALKKIIDLATRIELTLWILVPRSWNLLRNSTIHFHICSYSATHLLRVTGSTLWRLQFHNISSLFTNLIWRNWSKKFAWYHRFTFIKKFYSWNSELIKRFVEK